MDGGEGLANIAIHSFQLTNQIREMNIIFSQEENYI